MLEIESKRYIFKTKTIWFSEAPFDVSGYDGVTFHECTRDVDAEGFSKKVFTTLEIDLTQDLDVIWNKMGKSSCRQSINKATKEGVIIRVNQGYDTFYDLNSEFRKEKGLPEYNVDIEFMKKHGILFLSELNGEIIGGQLCISDGKMIWQAINYAKEKGMNTYDLGGYYTGETHDPQKESINAFKRSFGGELVTHYTYQKNYSKIYSLASWGYMGYKGLQSRCCVA